MSTNQTVAIIVAAGVGSRMKAGIAKQYMELHGRTMLEVTVEKFCAMSVFDHVYVAVSPTDNTAKMLPLGRAKILATGGQTREETVFNTLKAIESVATPDTLVAVHDAARALVDIQDIEKLLSHVRTHHPMQSGAVLAMNLPDTVKRIDADGVMKEDLDRKGLVRIATPQAFFYEELCRSLAKHTDATDESSAIRAEGGKVATVICSQSNFKITEPADLILANEVMKGKYMQSRVGIGFDSHRLVAGRKLILGGVEIEHHLGLDGHSDADVLIHAIIDALLGAAHLGNIGIMFPNTDERYRGADSRILLKTAYEAIKAKGWKLVNLDSVLIAEKPKLNPHLDAMIECLSTVLEVSPEIISIKPKTNEKLGFEGRQEGISAQVVVMIEK